MNIDEDIGIDMDILCYLRLCHMCMNRKPRKHFNQNEHICSSCRHKRKKNKLDRIKHGFPSSQKSR